MVSNTGRLTVYLAVIAVRTAFTAVVTVQLTAVITQQYSSRTVARGLPKT